MASNTQIPQQTMMQPQSLNYGSPMTQSPVQVQHSPYSMDEIASPQRVAFSPEKASQPTEDAPTEQPLEKNIAGQKHTLHSPEQVQQLQQLRQRKMAPKENVAPNQYFAPTPQFQPQHYAGYGIVPQMNHPIGHPPDQY